MTEFFPTSFKYEMEQQHIIIPECTSKVYKCTMNNTYMYKCMSKRYLLGIFLLCSFADNKI